MNVHELMNPQPETCPADHSLAEAAELMLHRDCGFLPVTDPESDQPVGVLTDRDVALGARKVARPLAEIPVSHAMSRTVWSCRPDDGLETAHRLMREHQVRRLAVVDRDRLVGVISLDEIATDARRRDDPDALRAVAETLGRVSEPQPLART